MSKSPEMENFLNGLSQVWFGRSREDGVCVTCGSDKVQPWDFRDSLSLREYSISKMCEKCQDSVFGKDSDE